ncbi:MAG: rhodanese-like domain-containing protein [Bacilli bacterium]|nr:rhodanese-like domain-containing protein [Bacilli bacterium]
MKTIKLSEYQTYMGILIDIRNPLTYKEKHIDGSTNIPYDKLLLHYKEYLDKNKSYYIMCSSGIKSKKAVRILEYYGYDVTQVET